ncbi:MAG TPA: Rieske 2Fe-2S domain-containing protein [Acidimicrobiales bacterium]|nr:Rieske 2Fe-2S domain-containing protein [Acidimicrobiales bacterium]
MAKPATTRSSATTRPARSGGASVNRDASGARPGQKAGDRRARRWLFLGPPPRALWLSGWALLPLRAFLGFTFVFAGLQKLANPNFFNSASPSGIQAQMIASERISPFHAILGHLLQFSTPLGILIALGELAVGLGALLGLWTRLAAVGGMLLSLTLFFTVSFHASPYYTGADIVFFFAWTPLVLAGSGGVLSLDAVIAARASGEARLGTPTLVPVPFSVVQQVCGHYENDRCTARRNAACEPGPCPFLHEGDRPVGLAGRPDEVDRRAVVLGATSVAAVGVAGLLTAGLTAGVGRALGGAKSPAGSGTGTLPGTGHTPSAAAPTTTTPPGAGSTTTAPQTSGSTTTAPASTPTSAATPPGTAVGPAKDVPVGGAARFSDPSSGDPSIVLQLTKGSFVAYDAVCPHAGCTVGYAPGAKLLVCPCHGSTFDPTNGDVQVGPAPTGLRPLRVAEGGDGQLYVNG